LVRGHQFQQKHWLPLKRAVKGVIDGGGTVASVDIWPDGRISVTVKEDKHPSIDPEDDPEVSRRLL
jgi:hypothetical protein